MIANTVLFIISKQIKEAVGIATLMLDEDHSRW